MLGFTLVELMVVLSIAAVLASVAVPSWRQYQDDQEIRSVAREISNAFHTARSQSLSTGNNHLVFIGAGPGGAVDPCGAPLVDQQGGVVPILVANDGAPGAGNCCFDNLANERVAVIQPAANANWGSTFAAGVQANLDAGGGDPLTGSTFHRQDGLTQSFALLFRPDGIPVAVDPACNTGAIGTGTGGVYVTNGNRDYAVVVSPLGTVNVRRYNRGTNQWQ